MNGGFYGTKGDLAFFSCNNDRDNTAFLRGEFGWLTYQGTAISNGNYHDGKLSLLDYDDKLLVGERRGWARTAEAVNADDPDNNLRSITVSQDRCIVNGGKNSLYLSLNMREALDALDTAVDLLTLPIASTKITRMEADIENLKANGGGGGGGNPGSPNRVVITNTAGTRTAVIEFNSSGALVLAVGSKVTTLLDDKGDFIAPNDVIVEVDEI